jgi:hypothetical protein
MHVGAGVAVGGPVTTAAFSRVVWLSFIDRNPNPIPPIKNKSITKPTTIFFRRLPVVCDSSFAATTGGVSSPVEAGIGPLEALADKYPASLPRPNSVGL